MNSSISLTCYYLELPGFLPVILSLRINGPLLTGTAVRGIIASSAVPIATVESAYYFKACQSELSLGELLAAWRVIVADHL